MLRMDTFGTRVGGRAVARFPKDDTFINVAISPNDLNTSIVHMQH